MRATLDYDLWMVGFTTAELSARRVPMRFVRELQTLFEVDDIKVTWLERDSNTVRTAMWSQLDHEAVANIYGRGAISLSDAAGAWFEAGLEWHKVSRRERERFLKNFGYQQNRLTLYTDVSRLDDLAFRQRYIAFCAEQALTYNVNYLIAYNPSVSDAIFANALSVGAGLRDVYWLNVFGRPFIDIIGKQHLLNCQASRVECLGESHVLVEAPDAVLRSAENAPSAVNGIKQHLGSQFFVPQSADRTAQGGVMFIGKAFGLLRKQSKAFHSTDSVASVRPTFDWRHVLLDK